MPVPLQPGETMADSDHPLLIVVFPEATQAVANIMVQLNEPELAARLLRQRFYGRCDCRPGCRFILTAPAGSSGTRMLWLEVSDEIVGEASLDPGCEFVTNFDISDCATAGIPLNWFEEGLRPSQWHANGTQDQKAEDPGGPQPV